MNIPTTIAESRHLGNDYGHDDARNHSSADKHPQRREDLASDPWSACGHCSRLQTTDVSQCREGLDAFSSVARHGDKYQSLGKNVDMAQCLVGSREFPSSVLCRSA